jgi:DNA-directed RNA polymerase specialized sigma24 family protein
MTAGMAMLAITKSSNQAVAGVPELGSAHDRSDEVLIRAIVGGDRRALQLLYGRHHVRVYRFVLRLTNASLAEDLVSEVFIDVWRQAGTFEGRSQVSTWVLAIARHKALSARRATGVLCRARERGGVAGGDASTAGRPRAAHRRPHAVRRKRSYV